MRRDRANAEAWMRMLSAVIIGMTVLSLGHVRAQEAVEVVLEPTEEARSQGIAARGTAMMTVLSPTKTTVTLNLFGVPQSNCAALASGSLLSAWLRFIDSDGNLDPGTAQANLVEPWGPPPAILPDAVEGCVAQYPIPLPRKGGATTPGCYPPVPNVISWSPLAKSAAGYTAGMGGATNPDPNAFLSDGDGEARVTLKTDFDFTGGKATVPLVLDPFFFGSSIDPFHAQCTAFDTPPAPPHCLAAGGVLKAIDSGFKRIYETKPVIAHQGPPAATFGPGITHDFDGPCDNRILTGSDGPCGRDGFTLEDAHPAGTDGGRGLRLVMPTPEGRQTLARGAATAISIVLHRDCVTHGHIPGNPEMTNGATRFPSEFTEILRGFLP